jgi:hypothetical protein
MTIRGDEMRALRKLRRDMVVRQRIAENKSGGTPLSIFKVLQESAVYCTGHSTRDGRLVEFQGCLEVSLVHLITSLGEQMTGRLHDLTDFRLDGRIQYARARARVMGCYSETEKALGRDRNAFHRRRCASAIRARPAFVLGPVDIPPWNRQRRFPGTTLMMHSAPARVLAQHLGRNLCFKGSPLRDRPPSSILRHQLRSRQIASEHPPPVLGHRITVIIN